MACTGTTLLLPEVETEIHKRHILLSYCRIEYYKLRLHSYQTKTLKQSHLIGHVNIFSHAGIRLATSILEP